MRLYTTAASLFHIVNGQYATLKNLEDIPKRCQEFEKFTNLWHFLVNKYKAFYCQHLKIRKCIIIYITDICGRYCMFKKFLPNLYSKNYIKWVKTSWTDSIYLDFRNRNLTFRDTAISKNKLATKSANCRKCGKISPADNLILSVEPASTSGNWSCNPFIILYLFILYLLHCTCIDTSTKVVF